MGLTSRRMPAERFRPITARRAIYLELFKDVVRNFVTSFARARQFAPTQAAAPQPAPVSVAPAVATDAPAAQATPTGSQ